MAGTFNKVILMGNLTRDIELRQAGGSTVGKIGLAVNRRFKTASGEQREEVCFVDCEAWGKTAEIMAKYLTKGRPVFIEGRLKLDQWEDKEGNKQSKLRVVVETFQFVDSRGEGGGGEGGEVRSYSRAPAAAGARSGAAKPEEYDAGSYDDPGLKDDDIPF